MNNDDFRKPELLSSISERLNQLGGEKIPFLFVIDFAIKQAYISPLAHLENDIFFAVDGFSNLTSTAPLKTFHLKKNPLA